MANSPATDPTIKNIGTTPVLFFPVPTPWPMSTGCNKNIYRQNNGGSILAWDPIYPQIAASALTERRQSCFPTQQQSWHFQDLNATPSTALGPAFVCPESYSAVAATVLESNSASRTEFTYCCPPYVPSSPRVAAHSYPIHELTPPPENTPSTPSPPQTHDPPYNGTPPPLAPPTHPLTPCAAPPSSPSAPPSPSSPSPLPPPSSPPPPPPPASSRTSNPPPSSPPPPRPSTPSPSTATTSSPPPPTRRAHPTAAAATHPLARADPRTIVRRQRQPPRAPSQARSSVGWWRSRWRWPWRILLGGGGVVIGGGVGCSWGTGTGIKPGRWWSSREVGWRRRRSVSSSGGGGMMTRIHRRIGMGRRRTSCRVRVRGMRCRFRGRGMSCMGVWPRRRGRRRGRGVGIIGPLGREGFDGVLGIGVHFGFSGLGCTSMMIPCVCVFAVVTW